MLPFKLAIVGAGPSSFYVASRILSLVPPTSPHYNSLRIHMFDRLWSPYGLVRYGVAPDHPEVKNCTHKFDTTATDPRLKFFGNVNITTDDSEPSPIPHSTSIPLSKILPHYTHLLLASGCTRPTSHPLLPSSPHVIPALSLVHWYTSHPASIGHPPPPLHKTEHVTVVGNGNVALDVARMLLSSPERLAPYDVPASVLGVLTRSKVQHVSIVGRRGPAQAAFTAKELREMMNLEGTALVPVDPQIIQEAESLPLDRSHKRILDILKKGSKEPLGSTKRTWSLDFFRSPTGISPVSSEDGAPLTLNLAHTTLSPTGSAVPTGAYSQQPTSLVVTALGHTAPPGTPWLDARAGHVRTAGPRVLDADGRVVRGVYASGWAAHGARGVLATTMVDAYGAAESMLGDAFPEEFSREAVPGMPGGGEGAQGEPHVDVLPREVSEEDAPPEIQEAVRAGTVTTYSDWREIDAEEVRRGEEVGKERERMNWDEVQTFLENRKRTS
ncbi:hypothetical protein EIP86_003026 [Pleurotus ostreatoroseus]|nr:hypothetical protein EIP86_003026 [Pleurotus ostreatoroseus]